MSTWREEMHMERWNQSKLAARLGPSGRLQWVTWKIGSTPNGIPAEQREPTVGLIRADEDVQ
jgi:hypothetical protein